LFSVSAATVDRGPCRDLPCKLTEIEPSGSLSDRM